MFEFLCVGRNHRTVRVRCAWDLRVAHIRSCSKGGPCSNRDCLSTDTLIMLSIVHLLLVLSATESIGHVLTMTESAPARRHNPLARAHSPEVSVHRGDATTSALSPPSAIPRGTEANPISALSSGHSCYYWVVYAAKCVPGHTDAATQECVACAAKHAANLTAEVCPLDCPVHWMPLT